MGQNSIYIAENASCDDLVTLQNADGFLIMNGGLSSYVARIARDLGKPAITKASITGINIAIKYAGKCSLVDDRNNEILVSGDEITIDGNSGKFFKGFLKSKTNLVAGIENKNFLQILNWAKLYSNLYVFAEFNTLMENEHANYFNGVISDGVGLVIRNISIYIFTCNE
jgi:phosphohistidine swiveling domain-containing protein